MNNTNDNAGVVTGTPGSAHTSHRPLSSLRLVRPARALQTQNFQRLEHGLCFFFLLTQMLRLTYKASAAGMITAANETERASKMSGKQRGCCHIG